MMGIFDSILQMAQSLSTGDRIRLARTILAQTSPQPQQDDEFAAGQRGLKAWTESTCEDDWSEFYPPSLSQRRVG